MIYNLKATAELNNDIAINVLNQFASHKIKLLIDERIAKVNLNKMEEKNKKRLSSTERARLLRPYILTSALKEELLNLRSKQSNISGLGSAVRLEQMNRKIPKDKYSAFSYGLYWIKLQDDSKYKKKRSGALKDFIFYFKASDKI